VNFWTSSWDSLEREKARLFTAARFRSLRIRVMSSSSLEASSGVTTGLGERPSLFCEFLVRNWIVNLGAKRRAYLLGTASM
jgi:hypothetical protein